VNKGVATSWLALRTPQPVANGVINDDTESIKLEYPLCPVFVRKSQFRFEYILICIYLVVNLLFT
jgi:hypothetical protein